MRKIYIEFLGIWGSGKSSICEALQEELINYLGEKNIINRKNEYNKYNGFIIKLIVFLSNRKRTLKLFSFWNQYKKKLKNSSANDFIDKSWYRLFKNSLINSFLFERSDSQYFLDDEGPLKTAIFYSNLKELEVEKLIEFYPGERIIFIYVDTSKEIAFSRINNRKHILRFQKNKRAKNKKWIKNYFNTTYDNIEKEVYFLEKNRNKKIKVIRVSGENSIKENVRILKNEILK